MGWSCTCTPAWPPPPLVELLWIQLRSPAGRTPRGEPCGEDAARRHSRQRKVFKSTQQSRGQEGAGRGAGRRQLGPTICFRSQGRAQTICFRAHLLPCPRAGADHLLPCPREGADHLLPCPRAGADPRRLRGGAGDSASLHTEGWWPSRRRSHGGSLATGSRHVRLSRWDPLD